MNTLYGGRSARALALTSLALVFGCNGSGPPAFDVTPVKGKVTMNGAPLADADVQFLFDGTPPEGYVGSAGKTDASGNYELTTNAQKGAIPGKFKVTVSKYTDKDGNPPKVDPEGGMDLEMLIQGGQAIQQVPPNSSDPEQTQQTAEVVAGQENVVNIDINK